MLIVCENKLRQPYKTSRNIVPIYPNKEIQNGHILVESRDFFKYRLNSK